MELLLCCYCLRVIKPPLKLTNEHLLPLSAGGADNSFNIRTCCNECNLWRGDKDYDTWAKQVKKATAQANAPYFYEKIIEQISFYKNYCQENMDKIYKKR